MIDASFPTDDDRMQDDFRAVLIETAERIGISVSDFCVLAAAEKLARRGVSFSGVFNAGDIDSYRDRLAS